ncbi:HET domain-containing protein [Colletotrichum chrysophilum]|uniref:HET domain-containing protein n=1 Tax=Colletotrichum chrysophilum TaxID=1836956 RepID=A0AAD9EMZ0_9PEZI|nr:HET domain-containing protein [Colletotrichum chrysophilum]
MVYQRLDTPRTACTSTCGVLQRGMGTFRHENQPMRRDPRDYCHRCLRTFRAIDHRRCMCCSKDVVGIVTTDNTQGGHGLLPAGTVRYQHAPTVWRRGQRTLRLQEEIIKVFTDQSIFAWDSPKDDPLYTMLAPSPAAFRHCHKVKRDLLGEQKSHPRHREFTITNFGLNISLPLLVQNQRTYFGALNCIYPEMHDKLICIPLSVPGSMPTGVFVRDGSRGVIMIPRRYFPTEPTSIYVPRDGDILRGMRLPIAPPPKTRVRAGLMSAVSVK